MTDIELIKFLGIENEPMAQKMIDGMKPSLREAYEAMAQEVHKIERVIEERSHAAR